MQDESFEALAQRGDGGKKSAPATVAVVSTAGGTLLLATNGSRVAALIQNAHATTKLYIGNSAAVTAANGIILAPGDSYEDWFSTDAWYGLAESGTGDARVLEVSR